MSDDLIYIGLGMLVSFIMSIYYWFKYSKTRIGVDRDNATVLTVLCVSFLILILIPLQFLWIIFGIINIAVGCFVAFKYYKKELDATIRPDNVGMMLVLVGVFFLLFSMFI